MLDFLCEEGRITETFKQRLLGWVHSGFSVHHDVKVKANDAAGQRQLARYMIRAPFSLEKTEYKADSGMIVYRSKMHKSLKRNYQIMPGAQWLELLLQHVPDKGEHLVRYFPELMPDSSYPGKFTNIRTKGEQHKNCAE